MKDSVTNSMMGWLMGWLIEKDSMKLKHLGLEMDSRMEKHLDLTTETLKGSDLGLNSEKRMAIKKLIHSDSDSVKGIG